MTRLRRAPLFVPGDSLHKIEKSLTLNTDAIILELEDGVAFNRKVEARQTVAGALKTLDFGLAERLVRINALETGLAEADLEATIAARPDGYVIPKVEEARALAWIDRRLNTLERERGWPAGGIRLLALIETPLSVMNLREIATATPRLDALLFGAEDLAGSMGAVRTRAAWEGFYAKSAVVTAAAAYGLDAIDTPYVNLADPDGLATEAQRAMEMGYCGKMAIHPAQLEALHQIFTPTPEAVAAARRLLDAYREHAATGSGAFVLDGKMVDKPMVRAAQKILDKMQH
jgi:citrate lyase beta subunit